MKKVSLAVLLVLLLAPTTGFARDWRHLGGHRHYRHYRHHGRHHSTVVIRHGHHSNGAIIGGVLGGVVTGIILDRILISTPPPQPVYSPPPAPAPAPRAPRDPYDQGYRDGYNQGIERGRRERYEEGKKRGYEEGYEDAKAGRAYYFRGAQTTSQKGLGALVIGPSIL